MNQLSLPGNHSHSRSAYGISVRVLMAASDEYPWLQQILLWLKTNSRWPTDNHICERCVANANNIWTIIWRMRPIQRLCPADQYLHFAKSIPSLLRAASFDFEFERPGAGIPLDISDDSTIIYVWWTYPRHFESIHRAILTALLTALIEIVWSNRICYQHSMLLGIYSCCMLLDQHKVGSLLMSN